MFTTRLFTTRPRGQGSAGIRIGPGRSARSLGAALGLCAAVTIGAAGCGSSGGSAGQATSTDQSATEQSASRASTTGAAGSDGGGADSSGLTSAERQTITTAFEKFFDGQSDAETKLGQIQDPDRFADTINAQAGLDIAKSTTVKVGDVDKVAPGRAAVTYTILMNDDPVLADQHGYAVREDDEWKVSASSFCTLLTLENEGTPPQECSGVAGSGGQGSGGHAGPTD